ncbi:MAG: FAD-dependent oxidoreductase, partial [Acinetobacter sp.]|nr:FAD-dependent oxidoreductase [Acinetobacter sp.]
MPRKKEVVSGTFVKYDAVVLGSGPAGEGAAMKLAKSGKRVAIVEMREQLGGNCTHVGTIPSKALRQTVSSIIRYQRDPLFQKVGDWKQFTMKQVLRHAHKVIQQQVDTHSRFYDRNKIDIYHGRAYVQDQNTIFVFSPDGIKETLMF